MDQEKLAVAEAAYIVAISLLVVEQLAAAPELPNCIQGPEREWLEELRTLPEEVRVLRLREASERATAMLRPAE